MLVGQEGEIKIKDLSPIGWAIRPLKRYAQFSGRSSRAEFWWFFLFLMILSAVVWIGLFMVIGISAAVAPSANPSPLAMIGAFGAFGIFIVLFWIALIIPTTAVQIRRLHDTNRSGWWIGGFWLLYVIYMATAFGGVFRSMQLQQDGSPATAPNLSGLAFVGILGLAMFIYEIILIVFWCLPGTKGANRFGDDPYGPDVEQVFA